MRYLSDKDLVELVSPAALIAVLEEALRDLAAGRASVPPRQHVNFGSSTLLTMPAIGDGTFGVKIVSVVPSNGARELPSVNGLMMLNDGTTGVPLAVLSAASLTAQRTGAIGALGIKYTTPLDEHCIGIIGIGVQGAWQAIFACAVRPIQTLYFMARSDDKATRFVDEVSRRVPSVRLSRCLDVHQLLSKTRVVITATSSNDPVLPADRELLEHKHVIAIGSYRPSMRELPNLVYQLTQQVVVDSNEAKSESGDLIDPISLGLLPKEKIIHLADLVTGRRSVDIGRATAFKSVGMALYDLYAARAFLAEAQRLGRGTVINN